MTDGEYFATTEQEDIGEQVHPEKEDRQQLTLPNSVKIKFEHILALAGDFYGIPECPIIDPVDEEDAGRYKQFMAAFNTIARAPDDKVEELHMLIAIADENTADRKQDEITGGKWVGGFPVKPGRMLKLAMNNHDHFLPHAKSAYLTGHQLAMGKAREASQGNTEDEKTQLLQEAYAMEAFACHFLTDSFASGHIRTPRVELGNATSLHIDGHYLSWRMHDEDGTFGLRVTNIRGDKWIAYGDGLLHKSKDNFRYVVEATQKSVNQVHEAYRDPKKKLSTQLRLLTSSHLLTIKRKTTLLCSK